MPGINFSRVKGVGGTEVFSWTLANGQYGLPIEISDFDDKTAHIYNTFGSGGSVTLYGSNNPDDFDVDPASGEWVAVVDPQGNAITKTSKATEVILENPRYLCPAVTAGDGTTSIIIAINAKRNF